MVDDARLNPNQISVGPIGGLTATTNLDLVIGAFEFIGEIIKAWVVDQTGVTANGTNFTTLDIAYGSTPTVAHSLTTATVGLTAKTPRAMTAAAAASRRPAAGDSFRFRKTDTAGGVGTNANLMVFMECFQSFMDSGTA